MRQEIDLAHLLNQLNHNCSDISVKYSRNLHTNPADLYLENAVDPQNFEPNLALDLEISDLINSKKGNA